MKINVSLISIHQKPNVVWNYFNIVNESSKSMILYRRNKSVNKQKCIYIREYIKHDKGSSPTPQAIWVSLMSYLLWPFFYFWFNGVVIFSYTSRFPFCNSKWYDGLHVFVYNALLFFITFLFLPTRNNSI